MKNNRKRIRGILFVSLLAIVLGSKNIKAIELEENVSKTDFYIASQKQKYMATYQDNMGNLYYRIDGATDYQKDSNYVLNNESLIYPDDELLNALYLTSLTKNSNIDNQYAMQMYLYNLSSSKYNEGIQFVFAVQKYWDIQDKLINDAKEMLKEKTYNYEIIEGKSLKIEDIENFNYEDVEGLEIKNEEDGIVIEGLKTGDYVIRGKTHASYNYYVDESNERNGFINVTSPKYGDVVINLKVNAKPKYAIEKVIDKGSIEVVDKAQMGDKITFKVNVLDGYQIKSILVYDKDDKPISVTDNTFTMPDSNVTIKAITEPKEYNITTEMDNGTIIVNDKGKYLDKITFSLNILDDYILDSIKVLDKNGSEIKIEDNSFIMPSSEVKIIVKTKKKAYAIQSFIDNGEIVVDSEKSFGEKVEFKVNLEKGMAIKSIDVRTLNGEKIKVDNNSFIMPKDVVFIRVSTEKKDYNIKTNINHGTIIVNKTANYLDLITFKIDLEDNYQIDDIKVMAMGEVVPYNNNVLSMPDSDIEIIVSTSPKKYKVNKISDLGVELKNVSDYYIAGEEVYVDYFLYNYYKLDDIVVETSSGDIIELVNGSFMMPAEDVTISIYAYYEEDNEDDYESPKYTVYHLDSNGNRFLSSDLYYADTYFTIEDFGYDIYREDEANGLYKFDERSMFMPDYDVKLYYVPKGMIFEGIPNTSSNQIVILPWLCLLSIGYYVKRLLFN